MQAGGACQTEQETAPPPPPPQNCESVPRHARAGAVPWAEQAPLLGSLQPQAAPAQPGSLAEPELLGLEDGPTLSRLISQGFTCDGQRSA